MRPWMPPLISDRGAIDHAIWVSLVVTGVVFIVTNLLLAWFSWRYQDARGRARHLLARQPQARVDLDAGHGRDPVRLPLQRARPVGAASTGPRPADAALVEVTGQQFAWNVRYPGKDGMLGRTDFKLASQENLIGLDPTIPPAADDLLLLNQMYLPEGPAHPRAHPLDGRASTASSCPTSA